MLQHGAYTLLIDACYDRERFPTMEEAIDWCWASSQQEIEAVEFVLKKFFVEVDGLFVQSRVQDEIDNYRANSEKNRAIAIEREAKRREKSTVRAHIVNDPSPNHKPITNNQEPINNTYVETDVSTCPPCPHKEIIEIYHRVLPELDKVITSLWKPNTTRYKSLQARWRESPKHQTLEFWERYFTEVKKSDWHMGRTSNWKANLEWLVKQSNFIKMIERFVSRG